MAFRGIKMAENPMIHPIWEVPAWREKNHRIIILEIHTVPDPVVGQATVNEHYIILATNSEKVKRWKFAVEYWVHITSAYLFILWRTTALVMQLSGKLAI